MGSSRIYLAKELDKDGRKAEASEEDRSALMAYKKALKAYQKSASTSLGKKEVKDAIRELDERGVQ